MTEGATPPSSDFDARLRAARQRQHETEPDADRSALPAESGAGIGYRVSVELFAGMAFGGGIGWLLDRWLGSRPWLMVLLFLLGAAAGLLNAYRAMMRTNRAEPARPEAEKRETDGRTKD